MAFKGLRRIEIPWDTQPEGMPEIDWSNPITNGLLGLVYTGPQFSRELVGPTQWCNEFLTTRTPNTLGVCTEVTSAAGGIYSVRHSLETSVNSAANWRPTAPPLSMAWYGSLVNPGATRALFGVTGAGGTEGALLTSAFSSSTRFAHVGTGAGTRVSVDNSNTPLIPGDTTWYPGVGLRGFTCDASAIQIYDFGRLMATNVGTASNIFYDTTFGRVQILSNPDGTNCTGTSHWGAIWNRVLRADEFLEMHSKPWRLFKPKVIYAPNNSPLILPPTLSALEAFDITGTTASVRETLTY